MVPRPASRARRLLISALIGTILLAWVVYLVANARLLPRAMAADDSCETDPRTVADMGQLTPGAAPIRCQPWDIGTGVRGYVWHAPNPRAVLLLQHGYSEYAQRFVWQYNHLIPHLLDLGISVYAIDLWGHGRSPGGRAVTNLEQAVQDHLAARRKLQEQPLPVYLFGHSMGGLVTASSAAREQGGLSGVILSSALLEYDEANDPFLRFLLNVLAFVAPTLPTPVTPGDSSTLASPDVLEASANDPLIYQGRMPILLSATILNLVADLPSHYASWTVPTLVMHGTADSYTSPEGSVALFAGIASTDKELYLVEGGRHELLNDTERDETLEVLLTWLEHHLPADPASGQAQRDAGTTEVASPTSPKD